MANKNLSPSILLALGLAGCKATVQACLKVAVDTDTDTDTDSDSDSDSDADSDTDVGPCLDFLPSGDTGDSGVGPCLDLPPPPTGDTGVAAPTGDTAAPSATGDTAIGPCLDIAPDPTGDTGPTDTGAAPSTTSLDRRALLQQLVERGVLPEDAALRLLQEE